MRPGFHPAPATIQPYAAHILSEGVSPNPDCAVVAIDAERTFWEKATILHQEAHRPGTIPARYSRHYYDLYRLGGKPGTKATALSDLALLKSVVEFKERFYYSSWARYDLALPGSFRLSPPENQIPAVERDYREMRDMFYREPPEFDDVLRSLNLLEKEINASRLSRRHGGPLIWYRRKEKCRDADFRLRIRLSDLL